jgi:hypothetical protein
MSETLPEETRKPLTELTRAQRRVLGVLIEKGITTPEVYPLTLKATTAGCNQKSNRDPVVSYDEDKVEQTLDELRELGLAAVVHTESGRSARYRHYMRHRFTLTAAQLAILTELLLRGRQSLGELRTRAGRMAPIDSLEQLRTELTGLMDLKFVRADGPLDRRGVEVDHNLYPANERQPMVARAPQADEAEEGGPAERPARESRPAPVAGGDSALGKRVARLEKTCEQLHGENRELRDSLESLKAECERLVTAFEQLRTDLGG